MFTKSLMIIIVSRPTDDTLFSQWPSLRPVYSPTMPLISSPIAYPLSSSPPVSTIPCKRSHGSDAAVPSKKRLFGKQLYNSANPEPPQLVFADLTPSEVRQTVYQNSAVKQTAGPFVDGDLEYDKNVGIIDAPTVVRPLKPMYCPANEGYVVEECTVTPILGSFIRSTSGKRFRLVKRTEQSRVSYEQLVAQRSSITPGQAKKCYYGIDVHKLIDEAAIVAKPAESTMSLQSCHPSVEVATPQSKTMKGTMMWTEKYRAKKFTDLVGDERTHRTVLRWMKGWDQLVFQANIKQKPVGKSLAIDSDKQLRKKILLLTGSPGLGKTTLAHVCARQAGYEVVEINASDERSQDVVRRRIKECVGTENVRGVNMRTAEGHVRKAGRPICLIVDEVDGVAVGNSSGGEGGFIKALTDLVVLDHKNSSSVGMTAHTGPKRRRGDHFRLLRPIILICNDVYHPALRPLRTTSIAEVIQVRKPPLDKVVSRMETIFNKEGIANEKDGVRRLCELAWGINNRREGRPNTSNTGDGDIRGILVVGELVAGKFRNAATPDVQVQPTLTRQWVEENLSENLWGDGAGLGGAHRGGVKAIVDRVFLEGAGFPKPATAIVALDHTQCIDVGASKGLTDLNKGAAIARLRDMVNTCGEPDRIMTDVFLAYPSHPFQDDTLLSKPNAACDWLNFHDMLSSKVFAGQEWELATYLSQPVLGFHYLFASAMKHSWTGTGGNIHSGAGDDELPAPFSGLTADYEAFEAKKQNQAVLQSLQSSLSATLLRSFRSAEEIATDLVPYVTRMLTPDVTPVVVGGTGEQRGVASIRREGERDMIRRSVEAMSAVGVEFERLRVEDVKGGHGGFVYCMEPYVIHSHLHLLHKLLILPRPVEDLTLFKTSSARSGTSVPARYAVRQVLDQELQKYRTRKAAEAQQARFDAGNAFGDTDNGTVPRDEKLPTNDRDHRSAAKPTRTTRVKRDFFGRTLPSDSMGSEHGRSDEVQLRGKDDAEANRIWVSYHEGFSNAVRKPVTLHDLMRGM